MKQENSFENLSYRGQVRILTGMAHRALSRYPIQSPKVEFINHGENATFRVRDSRGGQYLLRLHRPVYHTKEAISEELHWLKSLEGKVRCQRPVADSRGEYLCLINSESRKHARYCDVLSWKQGSIRHEKLSPESFGLLGELTARLHSLAPKSTKNRRYWTAEGLLGSGATFGSPLDMKRGMLHYDIYNDCRKMVYDKLSGWQRNRRDRLGVIHADLHFGNMLWDQQGIIPIDFDDCGFGFFMYDLAVTFLSSQEILSRKGCEKKLLSYLMGYQSVRPLDSKDMEMIPWLMLARKLGMLAWLYHRQDNPRFIPLFRRISGQSIPLFRKALRQGPAFDWLLI